MVGFGVKAVVFAGERQKYKYLGGLGGPSGPIPLRGSKRVAKWNKTLG